MFLLSFSEKGRKLFIGGLSSNARKENLEHELKKYGDISNIWVARNPPGFAFVEFSKAFDAEKAVRALDGMNICGSRIRVEFSHSNKAASSFRWLLAHFKFLDPHASEYPCSGAGNDSTRNRQDHTGTFRGAAPQFSSVTNLTAPSATDASFHRYGSPASKRRDDTFRRAGYAQINATRRDNLGPSTAVGGLPYRSDITIPGASSLAAPSAPRLSFEQLTALYHVNPELATAAAAAVLANGSGYAGLAPSGQHSAAGANPYVTSATEELLRNILSPTFMHSGGASGFGASGNGFANNMSSLGTSNIRRTPVRGPADRRRSRSRSPIDHQRFPRRDRERDSERDRKRVRDRIEDSFNPTGDRLPLIACPDRFTPGSSFPTAPRSPRLKRGLRHSASPSSLPAPYFSHAGRRRSRDRSRSNDRSGTKDPSATREQPRTRSRRDEFDLSGAEDETNRQFPEGSRERRPQQERASRERRSRGAEDHEHTATPSQASSRSSRTTSKPADRSDDRRRR
ncbi:unnamed protein product [Protopolystoma xenopodis]|uniref:RRM domain-containing protein n=1 Tax=Protopolystoma xenopodis TaxID=117903 RepID=A0A3S5BT56_9PLAT|nr:unnamed protein product [Protopolystoma xenopodis]